VECLKVWSLSPVPEKEKEKRLCSELGHFCCISCISTTKYQCMKVFCSRPYPPCHLPSCVVCKILLCLETSCVKQPLCKVSPASTFWKHSYSAGCVHLGYSAFLPHASPTFILSISIITKKPMNFYNLVAWPCSHQCLHAFHYGFSAFRLCTWSKW
jgi:hypothetical protein